MKYDLDYSNPVTHGPPSFPDSFPGVNEQYLLTQVCRQLAEDFAPLALNTVHPDYAGESFANQFILVAEGPRHGVGGGIVEWTRTYARVPQQFNQPQSVSYNFIGYITGGGGTTIIGRNRRTSVVPGRVQHDFFLLGTDGKIYDCTGAAVYTGPGGQLPNMSNVPYLPEHRYYYAVVNGVWGGADFDAIGYGPDADTPQVAYPAPPGTIVSGYYLPPYEAYPTREVYESWIKKTATAKVYTPNVSPGVAGTLTDTGLYEIVAVASQNSRWMGNIIERQTVYVRPQ
jgi:hypothetical protein